MENLQVKPVQLNMNQESETSDDVSAPQNEEQIKDGVENTSTDTQRTEDKKHLLSFICGGVWIDTKGQKWSTVSDNEDIITEKTMLQSELDERPDITFMVEYGGIKDTVIE